METQYYVGKTGNVYGKPIATPVMRLMYASLVEKSAYQAPGSDKKSEPKYSVTLGALKDDEPAIAKLKEIQTMALEIAEQYIRAEFKALNNPKLDYAAFRAHKMGELNGNPILRDGDLKKDESQHGHWLLVAKNPGRAPEDRGGYMIIGDMTPQQFYRGALVRCEITPAVGKVGWFYTLRAIRFMQDDGVRFTSSVPAGSLIQDAEEAIGAAMAADISLDAALEKALASPAKPEAAPAPAQVGISIL